MYSIHTNTPSTSLRSGVSDTSDGLETDNGVGSEEEECVRLTSVAVD